LLLSTFTVINTLDNGSTGSLRWAINQVDADKSKHADTIAFAIRGTGPFTITPQSALPAITHQVLIDGYSQPGAKPNTLARGENAVILIQLSGEHAGFSSGLQIVAAKTTVRGLAINQFEQEGIRLASVGTDSVVGNFLGTDVTGTLALPNGDSGVLVDGASHNTIGGTAPADRNLISGNTNQNVYLINGSASNAVEGNWVGLTAAGTATLPTNGNGISLFSAANNTIGGAAKGAGNVVGGQTFDGVVVDSGNGNLVQGNLIGTDPTGTISLGNGTGVLIGFANAASNTLGGSTAGTANLISGNFGNGVIFNPSLGPGNVVLGNLIGTDITGTKALPNFGDGIQIAASGVVVGGTAPGDGNVISGNFDDGILMFSNSFFSVPANDNLVAGNFIGTDSTGTQAIGNGFDGVALFGEFVGAANDSIGGTAIGAGNIIADNGHNGVTVGGFSGDSSSIKDPILSNAIFGNGGLGIDLGDDGVTLNQTNPNFFAPNNGQNYPDLISAANFGSSIAVKGTFSGAPSTLLTVQFYGDAVADPSGHGQGQFLLATVSLTTDSSGNLAFVQFLTSVPAGAHFITATATDPLGDTSEFAQDVPVVAFSTPIAAFNDSYVTDINTTLSIAAPGVQTNDISSVGGTFTSAVVANPAHGTVVLNANGAFTYTPNTGFTGTDQFTYHDVAGTLVSNVATVTIQVNPKTWIVTNTNDSGPGSLRQAILNANLSNSAPPDTIQFDIPGTGPFEISPGSALPTITHPTIINGYTQPGASVNTLAQGDNAVILIRLDGLFAGFTNGLVITAGGSTVEGISITDFVDAIQLIGARGNTITGDYIGTDTTGVDPFLGNLLGIEIENSNNNMIGGATPDARDVISGNSNGDAMEILDGSTGNRILGDYIGVDATGLHALANFFGILMNNALSTSIGGAAAGQGNVISGNTIDGVFAFENFSTGQGPDNSVIQGNLIGTDATGEVAIHNGSRGLDLEAGTNLLVGGTAAGAANVISGNESDGIGVFAPASDYLIEGNVIGADAAGSTAIPNAGNGVTVLASGVTIGGTSANARNVISGNIQAGVTLEGSDNLVENNFIGTDKTGASALGNTSDGVFIIGFPAANNTIGGAAQAAGNVIAFNGGTGVAVLDTSDSGLNVGNAILSNSIFGNAKLGIDLGGDGVTPNHVGGLITGPNGFENFPVLTSAVSSATTTTISGTLNAAASSNFTIQFFADPTADPSGFGQGQTLIGSIKVQTDASGNATFKATFQVVIAPGQVASAAATDPNGNTSEFAQDITITAAPAAVTTAAPASVASFDIVLGSLSFSPVDESTLQAVADEVQSTRPKNALRIN
jgi:hypothetical protein